ncbi:uncharacterized protein LOC113561055 [Rhopalosiphum maidis]|uniref:uncharacterized protein LOC113561055 n=1 Tax=Rhopalosiphum maidis TaxID=43146 RepID=UPI000F006114|nr:uncharacterized protein LOC113561055 [Rhopalosiphum maidis]
MKRSAAAVMAAVALLQAAGGLSMRRRLRDLALDDEAHRTRLARLAGSVNKIIDEYLGTRSVVMFADEVSRSDLGQRLLVDMGHPRLLVQSSAATDARLANGLVVYLQRGQARHRDGRSTDYDTVLGRLPSSDHSRHMVLWDGARGPGDRVDLHRIQMLFEAFWHHQLVDVAVLVPMYTGSIRVYAFNPYTGSRCNGAGPPIMVNVWSSSADAFIRADRVFGMDNKLKDLHKCPLKCLGIHRPPVSTVVQTEKGFQLSGSGLRIINFMQEYMNFTGIVTMAIGHSGVHFISETALSDNDSSPVSVKVKHRKADLAFGRFTRIFDSESDVEFIKEDQMDCFTWGLPSGIGHDPTLWINYVAEFSLVIWILIILSIVLAFGVVVALSQLTSTLQRPADTVPWSPLFILFYTYGTFIGAPIKVTPKSCALQVFLSNWLLYCLVVTSAYQAYLGSLITIPQTTPEINDQRTLLRTSLNLVGRQDMYYLINSSAGSSNDFRELVDRYQILPPEDFGHFIQRILLKRDTAVLASKRELIFYAQRYKTIFNDSRHLHVLPTCTIESYSSTFMLRKGSPFRHRISTIMSRLSETGIMQQWDRENLKEELVHNIVFTEDTILSMSQSLGAFVVLFFGLFLGFCAFIGEIVVFLINTFYIRHTKQFVFIN